MKYYAKCELKEFPAWAGAKQRLADIVANPKAYEIISDYIEAASESQVLGEEDINDFIWFYAEEVLADNNCPLYDEE